ncbi:MAG: cadherin-like domain-containing protein, partial [Planctomycetales bacterium]|nr:cadherin-like domain-containing protein [Planctomycetales bacterium]
SQPIEFRIVGNVISDPFAVDPEEPSDAEFVCPDVDDMFCYPGEIQSEDPFIWIDFIDSLPEIPSLTGEELRSALLGDWWSWYWRTIGENAPPLTTQDSFEIDADQVLSVPEGQGVLSNDFDPDNTAITAILVDHPQHGSVVLHANGAFDYTPSAHFNGVDEFTYKAFDFVDSSSIQTVSITIGTGVTFGDFDSSGAVDAADIDLLAFAIRNQDSAFDLNGDNRLDAEDLNFMITEIVGTTFGDANLDGVFDSGDLVEIFKHGQYEDAMPGNSGWATGDWDGDGDFTSADFLVAFKSGQYEVAASVTLRTPHSFPGRQIPDCNWLSDCRYANDERR